jgi:hypothetical protein
MAVLKVALSAIVAMLRLARSTVLPFLKQEHAMPMLFGAGSMDPELVEEDKEKVSVKVYKKLPSWCSEFTTNAR